MVLRSPDWDFHLPAEPVDCCALGFAPGPAVSAAAGAAVSGGWQALLLFHKNDWHLPILLPFDCAACFAAFSSFCLATLRRTPPSCLVLTEEFSFMMANFSCNGGGGEMSIAIIANPLAGRGRGQKVAQFTKNFLTEQGVDFQLMYTRSAGHAIELAQRASESHETVAALGGDGTIREVLEGIWRSPAALGIIPGGTGNDYARGLGIPREAELAIQTLLHGQEVLFDIGLENDVVFGQMASIGFSADVLEYVNSHRKGFWKGSAAFLAGIVATIRSLRSFPVKIIIDGQAIEKKIIALFALNMPYGGGGMQFAPEARYDSGHFHILLIEEIGKLDFTLTLPKIYSGKHVTHPAVTILTGKEVTIEGDPLPIMIDGDIFPAQPFHTKIRPKAMRVIAPKTPLL